MVVLLVLASTGVGCQQPVPLERYRGAVVCPHEVVNQYSHATDAYTQGLVFNDGRLIESTGIEGQSSLREVELETGKVFRRVDMADEYFAEGIAIVDSQIFQLTWISEKGFIYDVEAFEVVGSFQYEGEGWGLTYDEAQLVMSNGSAELMFRDPRTFESTRTQEVTSGDEPITRLNELEYIGGEVWANVWQTDYIALIDPQTGRVAAWLDLTDLLPDEERTETTSVLNGIAHDPQTGRTYVTGKFWPWVYEIRVGACPRS